MTRALTIACVLTLASCGTGQPVETPAHPQEPAPIPVPAADETADPNATTGEAPNPAAPAEEVPTEAPPAPFVPPTPLDGAHSTSMGAPNNGSLRGGFALPEDGLGYRHNPRRPPEAVYAAAETLNALTRAAALVAYEMPGGEVTFNDLGYEAGGPIVHHGSHQAGRDVDVLFYLLDEAGEPMPGVGAPIDPEGRGTDFVDLADASDDVQIRIDLPRTWRYVAALLEDPDAHLQRIFLAEHLRTMLLEEGHRQGAAESTLSRFGEETCQPSYPHDDHFHFRFYCTAEDIPRGCRDSRPLFDWRRAELRAAGVRPRLSAGPGRRAEVTTEQQARRRAGPMAPEVRAFLERRHAWMDKPHPGRPFCR